MKLILCLSCHDVTKLAKTWRTCACGKVGGQYLAGLNAEVTSTPETRVLGFHNGQLSQAIIAGDKSDGMGREFLAFIIPKSSPTVKRI